MPHLPLGQQIYLAGVLCAFTAFMLAVAWGYFQANRRSAQPELGWRSVGAGQGGEGRGQVQAARAFQADRA